MKCMFLNIGKHFGGAENYFLTIVDAWIEKGNQAFIITRKDSIFSQYVDSLCKYDCHISVNFCISDIIKVNSLIKKEKISLAQINGINSSVFLLVSNIRKVVTVHSDSYFDRIDRNIIIRKLFSYLEIWMLNRSDFIIFVSEYLKKVLHSRGLHNKSKVINNGVRMIGYSPKVFRTDRFDTLKICFVGRLEQVKGIEILVDALNLIKEENFICDIYGEGSIKHELENKIGTLELGSKVHFKGYSYDIRQKLSEYDALVLPSKTEASPLTVFEAMNAKILLICSEVGGIPFIITNNVNGYLFKKDDVHELKKCILNVIENPLKQIDLIENAYNDFIHLYKQDIMVKNTIDVLESVVKL